MISPQDYVRMVNEMAGGRLKIQYLIAGAVVKAFQVQDAVNKGVLDAGHEVAVYWYGKSKAASLFGTGPVFGQNAHQGLAWIYYGGGQALYDELMQNLGLNLVGFFCDADADPAAWLVQEADHVAEQMVGLKYRTVGLGCRPVSGDGGQGYPAAGRRDCSGP